MGIKLGEFNPFPKEQQLGKKRSKKTKNFSPSVKKAIFERDNWKCVRCGSYQLEKVPHHIIFKSQGGSGDKKNGATICLDCHREAHSKESVRRWFEEWQNKYLDVDGDLI